MSSSERIRSELISAARDLGADDTVDPIIERPRDPSLGDWTTNLAMTLARPLRKRPAEIAGLLRDRMRLSEVGVDKIDVAGPDPEPARSAAHRRRVRGRIEQNEKFGKADAGHSDRHIEWSRANPTGVNVGHAGKRLVTRSLLCSMEGWTYARVLIQRRRVRSRIWQPVCAPGSSLRGGASSSEVGIRVLHT